MADNFDVMQFNKLKVPCDFFPWADLAVFTM